MDLLKFRGRMEEWASPADRSHPDGDNKNCYVLDSSGKSEIKRRPYICQKHAKNAFLKFQWTKTKNENNDPYKFPYHKLRIFLMWYFEDFDTLSIKFCY